MPCSSASRAPARVALALYSVAFAVSLWRDVVRNAAKLSTMGGLTVGLTWTYDGIFFLGFALPLFLATLVTLVAASKPGGMAPAVVSASPERTVAVLRTVFVVGNLIQFALTLIAKYAIPVMSMMHNHRGHGDGAMAFAMKLGEVSGRAGMPVFWNMAWSFILAVRHPHLSPMSTFGLLYEHMIGVHRTIGWWTTGWLSWHSFGYVVAYLLQGTFIKSMSPTPTPTMGFTGIIGTGCLLIMAAAGISRVRRSSYNVFALAHWLYVPFVILSVLHVSTYLFILLPPIALFIIDRVVSYTKPSTAVCGAATATVTAVRVSADVVAVLIPVGPSPSMSSSTSSDLDAKSPLASAPLSREDQELAETYRAGRFVTLAFPDQLATPAHPFSIAAYSPANRTVSIMIRALGPWSRRLHALASPAGEPVVLRVAGPFSTAVVAADEWLDEDLAAAARDVEATAGAGQAWSRALVAGGVGVSKFLGTLPTGASAAVVGKARKSSTYKSPLLADSVMDKDNDVDAEITSTSSGTAASASFDLARAAGRRKLWLCKDSREYHMYAALGADLTGWEVYSRKGFAEPEGDDAVPTTFPLFEQRVAATMSTAARVAVFLACMAVYTAFYLVGRLSLKYDAKACAKVTTFSLWVKCNKAFSMLPLLLILVAFPITVQLISSLAAVGRTSTRHGDVFRCHAPPSPAAVTLVPRRFDATKDLDLVLGSGDDKCSAVRRVGELTGVAAPRASVLRSCTSKPVRNMLRGHAMTAGTVSHVDDGVGF
ncbi:Ferric reductase like transmembrane component [Blastocladiella emersonii ATCC 22665]|nr:Ferric reductase like transmembrane component [Blastocladiella emersonii ATCC 22665]